MGWVWLGLWTALVFAAGFYAGRVWAGGLPKGRGD